MRYSQQVAEALEPMRRPDVIVPARQIKEISLEVGMMVETTDFITVWNGSIPICDEVRCSQQLMAFGQTRPLNLDQASTVSFGGRGMTVSWHANVDLSGRVRYGMYTKGGFQLSPGLYEFPDTVVLTRLGLSAYERRLDHPVAYILSPYDALPRPPVGTGRGAKEAIYAIELICYPWEVPSGTPDKLIRWPPSAA